jgi:dinuclear metal center YbgI/SA1388 family protein
MPRAPTPVSKILNSFLDQFESRIASLSLAESWDNVGMLIECPSASTVESLRVITCIDLSNDVVSEAVSKRCNLILSYHPVMFRPIQSLSCTAQLPLLRCIESGINVFVPHTAMDTAQGGMNDHLCNIFTDHESSRVGIRTDLSNGASIGRIVSLEQPISLEKVFGLLKGALNIPQVRYASGGVPSFTMIRSVAVCVGSGASVLNGASADLYLTGEMTHHDILSAVAKGKSVILLDHSSSERPFLPVLAGRVSEFQGVEFVCVSESDVEPIKTA